MYEQFFGLRERPFDLTPNPRYLVGTEAHREALGNLVYAIRGRKGMALLVGEAGSGKTTVIRTALAAQPSTVHAVHLHNPTLTRAEFVELVARACALSEEACASKAAFLVEMEALLGQRTAAGATTVLVVDEAQSLPDELLEEVRLLANLETNEAKLLTVVLAGQPELARRLNNDRFRQLKQRVALRCELRPLTLQETAAYIAGRISAAGGVGAHVFTREAVTMIHERSGGLPRTISVICDNALLTAFALGQRPVNTHTVGDVCRDFDLPAIEASVDLIPSPIPGPPGADSRVLLVSPERDAAKPSNGDAGDAKMVNEAAAAGEEAASGMFGTSTRRKRFRFFGS
jgi:general secretion pathway protein A